MTIIIQSLNNGEAPMIKHAAVMLHECCYMYAICTVRWAFSVIYLARRQTLWMYVDVNECVKSLVKNE